MSDTLRTDLSQLSCAHMDDQEWGAAGWDHARQLERELAEALEWKRYLSSWGGTPEIVFSFIQGQQARIHAAQEVEKQRDALIEGLEKLASCDWVITLPDRMDAVREIANETLNKLKP